MAFQFRELTPEVRRLMQDEFYDDLRQGKMVYSRRMAEGKEKVWDALLDEAIQERNETWLTYQVIHEDLLKTHEERHLANGTTVTAKVPWNAAQVWAEGEFNRYYARAICRLAIARGLPYVMIYRAKPVLQPRRRSERFIGTLIHAETLLLDLQAHQEGRTALGLLSPNSGLTVRTTTRGAAAQALPQAAGF